MHQNEDGFERKAHVSDADKLEAKEMAIDRIMDSELFFLVSNKAGERKLEVVWLAPVTLEVAVKALRGIEQLRQAILQGYVDQLDEEGYL